MAKAERQITVKNSIDEEFTLPWLLDINLKVYRVIERMQRVIFEIQKLSKEERNEDNLEKLNARSVIYSDLTWQFFDKLVECYPGFVS